MIDYRKGLRITNFTAEQSLSITVRDLSKLDTVMDAVMDSKLERMVDLNQIKQFTGVFGTGRALGQAIVPCSLATSERRKSTRSTGRHRKKNSTFLQNVFLGC